MTKSEALSAACRSFEAIAKFSLQSYGDRMTERGVPDDEIERELREYAAVLLEWTNRSICSVALRLVDDTEGTTRH